MIIHGPTKGASRTSNIISRFIGRYAKLTLVFIEVRFRALCIWTLGILMGKLFVS